MRNEGGVIELEVVVRGGNDTPKIVNAHSVVVIWDFEEGWCERVGEPKYITVVRAASDGQQRSP